MEIINNLVDMKSTFKVQVHDQAIVYIVIEEKYLGGGYNILYPEKK